MPERSTVRCVWPAAARLGEGTWWSDRLQSLWWVDILGRQLHRYRPADGAQRSWPFDTEITAVVEDLDGGLVVTLRRGFARFDPAGSAPPVLLYTPPEEPAGNRFNDGKCDAEGRFWAATMDDAGRAPTGALYVYDGRCVRHEMRFPVTNGPAWSLDGATLYVNDTARRRVFAFDRDASNRRLLMQFAESDGHPDGMTTDAEGCLWIAHWGGHCVTRHDPVSGAELQRVPLPVSQVTDCAFGGPGLRTLYITSARDGLSPEQLEKEPLAGGLFAVEVGAAGLLPNRYSHTPD